MRKIIFPVLLTLAGCAVLLWLGIWQLQRLAWKEAVLDDLNARIAAPAKSLPDVVTEADDEYTAVTFQGVPTGQELHVLVSGTAAGTGYRVISAYVLDGNRRVMVDLGLLQLEDKERAPELVPTAVYGNLIWPDDVNSATPAPDLGRNIWFGRDVPAMAAALGTEPVMVVASSLSPPDPRTTPLPVDTDGIKNDHWEYAVTWFGLALVWAVMGLFLIGRTLKKD